jgi:hypothetical protein
VQGVTKFTKTFEFFGGVSIGVENCVRVAHGYGDRRMPEQLLTVTKATPWATQPRCKGVVEAYVTTRLDSLFSARQGRTRFQIDKWIPVSPRSTRRCSCIVALPTRYPSSGSLPSLSSKS